MRGRTSNLLILCRCFGAFVMLGTQLVFGAGWVQTAELSSDEPYPEQFFGNTVAISGDFAAIGTLDYDTGNAFIFERYPEGWSLAAKLSSGLAPAGRFGSSVAIDGNYVIVGAKDEPNGGAAYVYYRDTFGWTQEARLVPTDMTVGNYFGFSAAVHGEFALVGAPGSIYGDSLAGEAFLFHRGNAGWNQVAKLVAADTRHFGTRVSLTDNHALIGSCSEAAYVFQYDQLGTTQVAKLIGSDTTTGDQFGRYAVAIDGEYAIVGAARDDEDGDNSGSAYVFRFDGNSWTEVQKLGPSDAAAYSYFGSAASLKDGLLVIGADYTVPGSAYVFQLTGPTWTEVQKLQAADGSGHDYFGWAVSVSGINVLVGAFADDHSGSFSGSAYVFEIPEPGTLGLLAFGSLGLIRRKRK